MTSAQRPVALGILGVVLILFGAAFEPADPTISTPAGPAVLSSCNRVRIAGREPGGAPQGVPSWRCAATWVFDGRRYDAQVQRTSAVRPDGQEIQVFVDPDDPDRHSFQNPSSPALPEPVVAGLVYAGTAVVGVAVVWGLVAWRRRTP